MVFIKRVLKVGLFKVIEKESGSMGQLICLIKPITNIDNNAKR